MQRQAQMRMRIIFAAATALLVAQTSFIHHYGEPYPAIVMPAFRGSGGYRHGRVDLVRCEAVFVADGEEFSFPPRVLLEEFPDSHRRAIASASLKPGGGRSPGPERTSRLGRLLGAIFPGYAARGAPRDSPEATASLEDWLHARSQALVPGRHVSRVEIRWYRERMKGGAGGLRVEREPAGALVVPTGGGQR